jgi:glycosyl transferase family 90
MRLIFLFLSCLFINYSFAKTVFEDLRGKVSMGPPQWAIEQIENDFKSFSATDITMDKLDQAMARRGPDDYLLVRYLIENGQISVQNTTPAVHGIGKNRLNQLNHHLNELARLCQNEVKLPNCEFIISLHDCFYGSLNTAILSFARNRSSPKVILIPDTDVLVDAEGLQRQAATGNQRYPWESKQEIAFWRGATTGAAFSRQNYGNYPRFQLARKSLDYPDWVDAKFTLFCQGAEHFKGDLVGYAGGSISVPDHFKYKYQILVDGNSCAYSRAYWQLFGNSVILKNDSEDIQWYYHGLQPYKHYIPVASDFHDLIEKLTWAKNNDAIAREISRNAQDFAQSNLSRADLYYYLYLVITRYALLQQTLL